MSKRLRKFLSYILLVFCVCLALYIIIGNACMDTVINGRKIIKTDELIAINVMIPFLTMTNSYLLYLYFREFTKEDALWQLEQQFKNGVISFESYKKMYQDIEKFDLQKKKIKFEMELEKKQFKNELKRAGEKIINDSLPKEDN